MNTRNFDLNESWEKSKTAGSLCSIDYNFPCIPASDIAAFEILARGHLLVVSMNAAMGTPHKAAILLLWSSICSSADHQGDEAYMLWAKAGKCQVEEQSRSEFVTQQEGKLQTCMQQMCEREILSRGQAKFKEKE